MNFDPDNPRLSKIEYGCYLALSARSRSEDPDTQVGTALFDKDWRTVSTGFNGFGPGMIPKSEIIKNRELKSCLINHAELNAILYSTREAYHACLVYSPCMSCAKTIAASKIKNIYFLKQYVSGATNEPDLKYQQIFKFHDINHQKISDRSIKKIMVWLEKDKQFLTSLVKNE